MTLHLICKIKFKMDNIQSASSSIALEQPVGKKLTRGLKLALLAAVAIILAVLFWQGITAAGNPDPTRAHIGRFAAIMDIAVLVFREGLECVLVLSAITASLVGIRAQYKKPIAWGAGIGAVATLATWFIAVGILSSLLNSVSALSLQAWTGLLAIIVLLIVMNWFFHRVYWGGWISMHNRKKKQLLSEADNPNTRSKLIWGFVLLGFASFYRQGFEVVLFLQTYNLQLGGEPVFWGSVLGLFFAGLIAWLTFVGHRRLPYRKMLVLTGALLCVVLMVMVGEQVQEMQQAGWIGTTNIPILVKIIPDWMGVWFSVFPNFETFLGQGIALLLVLGSYFWTKRKVFLKARSQ